MKQISRRTMLGTVAAMVATAAFAEDVRWAAAASQGPAGVHGLRPARTRCILRPSVLRTSDRSGKPAPYSNSDTTRARIGAPQRAVYGPTEIEKLDIYRTSRPNAPVFVFIHGGNWLVGSAKQYGYAAEMFINAGAHYVALDFIAIKEAGGDLGMMAAQVRRGIAWIYKSAATFGGDPERIFIGGHSWADTSAALLSLLIGKRTLDFRTTR